MAFIKGDLADVDRDVTPWVIVAGHRPLYLTGLDPSWDKDQQVAAQLRAELEDLFYEHGADLVLAGHHHSYQRTCPLYKGECKPAGTAPVYMVIGMAGFMESPIIFPANKEFVFVDRLTLNLKPETRNPKHHHECWTH
ncbi:Metallo-dependent phosphatase-like protein [Baffinella frigidus]|nr:Metallo-dependent phosphatase-like protein [Cryptophyta sp. CCMP2293]